MAAVHQGGAAYLLDVPERQPHPHDACDPALTRPRFHARGALGLAPETVRALYPRFEAPCPGCGTFVIEYASWEHYRAGEW